MHLIFERSNGRFKSNCNILALAWIPYYNEARFRHALLDYHQKQLMLISNPNNRTQNQSRRQNIRTSTQGSGPVENRFADLNNNSFNGGSSQEARFPNANNEAPRNNGRDGQREQGYHVSLEDEQSLSSRLMEQYQRYYLFKFGVSMIRSSRSSREQPINGANNNSIESNKIPSILSQLDNIIEINDELDHRYGMMPDFGWLALGNIGKFIGITLTSIAEPPVEIVERKTASSASKSKKDEEDLIILDDDEITNNQAGTFNQDNPQISGPSTFNSLRPDKKSCRTNYNLRGHLDEIIIVKWNELYQKLATVDSKGNVLIWCKINEKFTMQTPFYNRTKTVADFSWSNDGKTALICYTDSFILVGSSSSQRNWHSMLNLEDYHITCASWTPNDEQLLLGVSNGNVVVIDLPRSELTELVVSHQVNIRAMTWSSSAINLRDLSDLKFTRESPDDHQSQDAAFDNIIGGSSSVVVNHRRLNRDCSIFSRYRFCSQAPESVPGNSSGNSNNHTIAQQLAFNSSCPPIVDDRASRSGRISTDDPASRDLLQGRKSLVSEKTTTSSKQNILAIDFADSTIGLYVGGLTGKHSGEHSKRIRVNLESYIMSWSSNGEILAVAGFTIYTSAPSIGCLRCRYMNVIHFYNRNGNLIHRCKIKHSRHPITAFTWAHRDKRIFVATGPKLHCAQVLFELPKLTLLALSFIQEHTRLANKADTLENLFFKKFYSFNVLNWQSSNCPLELPSNSGNDLKDDEGATKQFLNNSNVIRFGQMHAKLRNILDKLFSQTIRQPFDEQFSLSDIAWYVPKNNQQFYCTLICYSSESFYTNAPGALGRQYRTDMIGRNNLSSPISPGANSSTGDKYNIFVLYVEFQGSLIPILKARRVGWLKPEFVIFDPQDRSSMKNLLIHRQQQKVSDIFSTPNYCRESTMRKNLNHSDRGSFAPEMPEHCMGLSQPMDLPCSSLHTPNHLNSDHLERSYEQRSKLAAMMAKGYGIHDRDQVSTSLDGSAKIAFERASMQHLVDKQHQRDSLPETDELIRIRSNVWGTKFKLIQRGNRVTKQHRVQLGFIEYKASILHLQPRQICLVMRDMSNYCVLCSLHHHSLPKKKSCGIESSNAAKREAVKNHGLAKRSDLIESLGNCEKVFNHQSLPHLPPPLLLPRSTHRDPDRDLSRQRSRDASISRRQQQQALDQRVILSVGDGIRIAPKLEPNQCYRFHQKYQHSSRSHRSPRAPNRDLSLGPQGVSMTQSCRKEKTPADRHTRDRQMRPGSSLALRNGYSLHDSSQDDVLTVSLGQGDQVRMEMSSVNLDRPLTSSSGRQQAIDSPARKNNLEEFLESNKTIKSIQSITKMIVDLSSKASEAESATEEESMEPKQSESSPSKLLKTSTPTEYSPARHFVPPQAPVHRPRKPLSSGIADHCGSHSLTSTPLRRTSSQARRQLSTNGNKASTNHTHESSSLLANCDLPPPPPSVPFGRRLSSSAKRFFDGSLRSLTGISGYSMSSQTDDTEECQPLVESSSRAFRLRDNHQLALMRKEKFSNTSSLRSASQPTTPKLSRCSSDVSSSGHRKENANKTAKRIDLSQLKCQLMQKLRSSTRNLGSNDGFSEATLGDTRCTSKTRWTHRSGLDSSRTSENESSFSSDSESDDGTDGASIHSDASSSSSATSSHVDQKTSSFRRSLKARTARWSSDKDLTLIKQRVRASLNGGTPQRQDFAGQTNRERHNREGKHTRKDRRRRKSSLRRTICGDSNCCCAREFKLNNRPPVWNEQSQVYQLDFSGRVTQESAKNLQIDFEGNRVSKDKVCVGLARFYLMSAQQIVHKL